MRQRRRLHDHHSAVRAMLLAVVLAACGRPTGPDGATGPLEVRVGATELQLVNRGSRPVHTFVAEREALALLNWAPCADPVRCPGMAPGAEMAIPFTPDGRLGLAPGREAVVTWWYARRTPVGYEPDSLRWFVVRL